MHIRKYDFDYSRRFFMEKTAKGIVAGAGVLSPLWPEIAHSADITKAYPEELLSIEAYTKGKIKTGDVLTADNVDIVKNLLDPIAYKHVKEMGRRIKIVPTTKDVTRLYPHEFFEATLRNKGKARLDADGNVWTADGKPWIGGIPFPEASTALEAFTNVCFSWGRRDSSAYAIRDIDLSPSGDIAYQYDFGWIEEQVAGRLGTAGAAPYKNQDGKLRFQTVVFNAPTDVKGTAYLSTWHYDQRKFPDLVGYVPAFKRVRRFPTNQRFEPLVAGITLFLSDAWGSGDPSLTWGNYKMVGRQPFLAAQSQNWIADHANWERPLHGGAKGNSFPEVSMEFVPEVLVVDSEPVGYPRAPVGRKRVWIDVRNMLAIAAVTYDRRGELWKSFEPAFSLYEKGGRKVMDGKHTLWTWTHVISHDIQSNRMSILQHVNQVAGLKGSFNDNTLYEKYMTEQSLLRLGA